MIQQTTTETSRAPAPEAEEVRAELQKILASALFVRSERPSRFLQFVCEMTLDGNGSKLNEYVIAHEVFRRGSEYSPVEDSVVRRQAHALRQKLHEYYAGEGSKSQVRIELPVGRYVPAFSKTDRVTGAFVHRDEGVDRQATANVGPSTRKKMLAAGALAAMFVLGAMTNNHIQDRRASGSVDPAIAELWGAWLSDPAGAVICFSNPMTAVVKQFPFTLPPDPRSYPPRISVAADQSDELRNYFELPAGGHFFLYPAKSQAKMGEALGSNTLTSLLTRAGLAVRATQSRFLSWENFRDQNLILLGHDEANPWLDPILGKLPIRMVTTGEEKARHIVAPGTNGAGAREFYLERRSGAFNVSRDYALVSMIGGVDGRHQLLLINGLNTEGTQIGMEYLCDRRTVNELLDQLRHSAPDHRGPWRFQIVLRTEVRDQVPTRAELLIARVL